jgi:hypothetical protein
MPDLRSRFVLCMDLRPRDDSCAIDKAQKFWDFFAQLLNSLGDGEENAKAAKAPEASRARATARQNKAKGETKCDGNPSKRARGRTATA